MSCERATSHESTICAERAKSDREHHWQRASQQSREHQSKQSEPYVEREPSN